MENASKALIIAGAILLSILIIALGMRIYNSASSSAGNADLSAQEVSAHNSQFEAYTGKIKGNQLITLLNLIKSNNEEFEDRKISIVLSEDTTRKGFLESKTDLSSTNAYYGYYLAGDSGTTDVTLPEAGGISTIIQKVSRTTTYQVDFGYNNGLIYYADIHVK